MYNFIIENKLTFIVVLLIVLALTVYFYNVKEKLTEVDPTEQINESLDQDNASPALLIDNEVLNGKIELPAVEYSDPGISNLYVNFVDEKNEESLNKYTKGAVVFDQSNPLNSKC